MYFSQVLKSADAALEDLRAVYFKRIIGMRNTFVDLYESRTSNPSEAVIETNGNEIDEYKSSFLTKLDDAS